MKAFVSIIVPIYNSEKHLEQCLNSVLAQSWSDYEVILIDDGSTDNSREIYGRFLKLDKRFAAYHQANKGASAARNYGLDVAQGKILIFLDSDDVIFPTFLEHIVRCMDDGKDLVCFSSKKFRDRIQLTNIEDIRVKEYTPLQSIENLLYHKIPLSVTRAAYRRETFAQLRFMEDLYICEDVVMLLEILILYEGTIPFIETELYGYRIHKESITHYGNWRKKLTGLTAMEVMKDSLVKSNIYMEKAWISRCMNSMRLIYKTIPWKEREERDMIWRNIKQYRKTVMFDRQAAKRERVSAAVSLCGQSVFRLFLCMTEAVRQRTIE